MITDGYKNLNEEKKSELLKILFLSFFNSCETKQARVQ